MLDHAAIHQAAAMLLDCWRGQQTLPQLPPGCRPTSRAEGYAIQREMLRLSGNTRYGWKIAATSTAGQSHIGVDGPLAGMIHSAQVLAEGSDVPIANSLMKVAEVEFAFRMGATLAPRAQPYSNTEVMGAVATLLLSDALFRVRDAKKRRKYGELVDSVRAAGGEALVLSSLHESGEQLNQLGGVAAVLRFPLPELEDMEMVEDEEVIAAAQQASSRARVLAGVQGQR